METQAEYDWWELGRADGMALGLLTILNHRGVLATAVPRGPAAAMGLAAWRLVASR
jgi:hypothetical protein